MASWAAGIADAAETAQQPYLDNLLPAALLLCVVASLGAVGCVSIRSASPLRQPPAEEEEPSEPPVHLPASDANFDDEEARRTAIAAMWLTPREMQMEAAPGHASMKTPEELQIERDLMMAVMSTPTGPLPGEMPP